MVLFIRKRGTKDEAKCMRLKNVDMQEFIMRNVIKQQNPTWKEKGKRSCHGIIGFMKDGFVEEYSMTCTMKILGPSMMHVLL